MTNKILVSNLDTVIKRVYCLSTYCLSTDKFIYRGAYVAQLVKHLTLALVMILWFVGWSLTSGSVLTAQSLEPALDPVSPSLSSSPPLMLCLSVSLSQK